MNKYLVAGALALTLAACAAPGGPRIGGPRATNVDVLDGEYILVDQEPVLVKRGESPVLIWKLDPASPYTFPADGITFRDVPEGEFRCHVTGNDKQFHCQDRNSRPGKYKYTVKVQGGGKPIPPLDPFVWNL